MKKVRIDVNKINKAYIYEGKKGKYLDLMLFDNKTGRDQYGNDGYVVQDLPKDARDRGERGEILGNWSEIERKAAPAPGSAPAANPKPQPPAADDACPF